MPSLWFVTPVHGREALTRLCLEQRARLLAELAGLGVEAHQVVVGDDGNLAAARELGFVVLERPNEVGRKVNDGIEYACREGGAEFVSYIGSDDWALAAYFVSLPSEDEVRTGSWRAVVSPEGNRLVVSRMNRGNGIPPWIIPVGLLAHCGYRPAGDERMAGVDGSIRHNLPVAQRRRGEPRRRVPAKAFVVRDVDELQRVGFKGGGNQITPWERALPRQRRWRIRDEADPWAALATRYPADLCERAEALYAERRAA